MGIFAIDPGESIGLIWIDDSCQAENSPYDVWGCTLKDDRLTALWEEFTFRQPRIIIYEEFALRQSAATKLVGNKFITCEVIGVIKLWADLNHIPTVALRPLDKEFCGFSSNPKDPHFQSIKMLYGQKITEHTRDAYRLYKYAELFRLRRTRE